MVHIPSRHVSHAALALSLALGLLAAPAEAQTRPATVRVPENLRAEPNGVVVAVLESGTPLEVVREQGSWAEVVVQGWVWFQSLLARDGGSYDYQIGVPGGENLRARPQGAVLARLQEGMLLEEVERAPGWARVRRRAWIWKPSIQMSSAPAEAAPPREAGPTPSSLAGTFRAGSASPVLTSPDGDTLLVLRPGAEVPVTARQGNWARVRLDGWVWMPAGQVAPGAPAEEAGEATVAQVTADPGAFVGRLVTWELQFVSLEEAEAVRTDFYEGEPFLLTRPVGDESTRFVYVAVPPEALVTARGLSPLERITVVGRIRTGASNLTGAPIVDLVELLRRR